MRFIMAYSGGKDCTLCLDRMIRQGHEPVALYTTVTKRGFNYNHGIRKEVFKKYEEYLGIPVVFCETEELHNEDDMYKTLSEAISKYKAEAVCTGDIYREDVAAWNRHLAERLGIDLLTPLWNEKSEDILNEVLERGYKFLIKAVKTDYLSEDYIGREINKDLIEEFKKKGMDICGEDGEYHSITVDGPIFKTPMKIKFKTPIVGGGRAMSDVILED